MTPKQKDLARRFVKSKHWRWMPGMSLMRRKHGPAGGMGLRPTHLRVFVADVDRLPLPVPDDPHWVPDLTDPATLGCILALVRDATDDRRIHCRARANVYRVYSGVSPVGRWVESEAEALLLALEAV